MSTYNNLKNKVLIDLIMVVLKDLCCILLFQRLNLIQLTYLSHQFILISINSKTNQILILSFFVQLTFNLIMIHLFLAIFFSSSLMMTLKMIILIIINLLDSKLKLGSFTVAAFNQVIFIISQEILFILHQIIFCLIQIRY